MRIVSLLPSATEIVYRLGAEPVATSHECDYPPEATEKPAVNRSRVDPDASSASINEQVADAEESGGVYAIDDEALRAADPDLVVSQGVCDVCAVDSVLVREAVDRLGLDCEVLTTDPHSLSDVFEDVERVGEAIGREDRAREVVAGLRERVRTVEERVPADDRPRTAVLDWMDPVMVAGHWLPGLVETAGGAYGLEDSGARSRPREWSEIREYDPEALVVAPCGFELDHAERELDALIGRPGFSELTAVSEGRGYVMDGHHLVNRPGPRLVDTLEHLAWCLHPDAFPEPPAEAVRPLARAEA